MMKNSSFPVGILSLVELEMQMQVSLSVKEYQLMKMRVKMNVRVVKSPDEGIMLR
jgi:hypothetical protein